MKRSRLRRRTARRVGKETPGDRMYVAWLHLRPCVGRAMHGHGCFGAIEQSHERNMTGLGLKAPPRRSIPMCTGLHRDWEQHRGAFFGWSKEKRREFMDAHIGRENAMFERGEDATDLGACPF